MATLARSSETLKTGLHMSTSWGLASAKTTYTPATARLLAAPAACIGQGDVLAPALPGPDGPQPKHGLRREPDMLCTRPTSTCLWFLSITS